MRHGLIPVAKQSNLHQVVFSLWTGSGSYQVLRFRRPYLIAAFCLLMLTEPQPLHSTKHPYTCPNLIVC